MNQSIRPTLNTNDAVTIVEAVKHYAAHLKQRARKEKRPDVAMAALMVESLHSDLDSQFAALMAPRVVKQVPGQTTMDELIAEANGETGPDPTIPAQFVDVVVSADPEGTAPA